MTAPRPRAVLVAVASRHGGTTGVAASVAEGLREALGDGASVDLHPVEDVERVSGYDAVVVGSAVYFGHWLEGAREFVLRCAIDLWERPVWAFSSGPLGIPGRPPEELLDVEEMSTLTRWLDHRVFPGRLDRAELGFAERAMVTALHAPEGDFRDPATARAWGREIATALVAPEGTGG